MVKRISILGLLFLAAACDPKDAEVASKTFESPPNDGFQTFSITEPTTFNKATWFFWKERDQMDEAMRAAGALEVLEKKITDASVAKQNLTVQRHQFLLENLGPDNQVIWEDLKGQLTTNVQTTRTTQQQLEAEEAKPETERDPSLIEQYREQIRQLEQGRTALEQQIQVVEQQRGLGAEFGAAVNAMNTQLETLNQQLAGLTSTARTYQGQFAQLVELMPEAPKMRLHEQGGNLSIELLDFKRGDLECSTAQGTIRDVVYRKSDGYISFTAICKQPDWATAEQLVSYKVVLERIPTAPVMLLSGNMGRCVDQLPNLGRCEAGLSYGVIKYSR
jgi:hypothetical protein